MSVRLNSHFSLSLSLPSPLARLDNNGSGQCALSCVRVV